MVALQTPLVDTNFNAVDFYLKGTDGKMHSLENTKGDKGLLVMFICNHCPFVKSILDKLVRDTAELVLHGVNSVAIMSNDPSLYSEDSFENMQRIAQGKQFSFPYLIDETQAVAKAYGAICTPDFFGFDKNLNLKYRGRLDNAGMQQVPDANRDLFHAMVEIAETGKVPEHQQPSIGCSIKWIETSN